MNNTVLYTITGVIASGAIILVILYILDYRRKQSIEEECSAYVKLQEPTAKKMIAEGKTFKKIKKVEIDKIIDADVLRLYNDHKGGFQIMSNSRLLVHIIELFNKKMIAMYAANQETSNEEAADADVVDAFKRRRDKKEYFVEQADKIAIGDCPCGETTGACPVGCACGKCAAGGVIQKPPVYVRLHNPVSGSVKTSIAGDLLRGDVPITSANLGSGTRHTQESSRLASPSAAF